MIRKVVKGRRYTDGSTVGVAVDRRTAVAYGHAVEKGQVALRSDVGDIVVVAMNSLSMIYPTFRRDLS